MASGSKTNQTNRSLIHGLQGHRYIRSSLVADVMMAVDRGLFCKFNPYQDAPQSIGFSVTISAPHMHAIALEHLSDNLNEGSHTLDVGSGSGYLTACMAYLVGDSGCVVGIEHIEDLVRQSQANFRKHRLLTRYLENGALKIVHGDGQFGYPPSAPYDAIHVGAAALEIPQALIDQLNPGGRLIIPVGPQSRTQSLMQIDKGLDGSISKRKLMAVSFVPLTSKKNLCWS